jgi:hypothetical protein
MFLMPSPTVYAPPDVPAMPLQSSPKSACTGLAMGKGTQDHSQDRNHVAYVACRVNTGVSIHLYSQNIYGNARLPACKPSPAAHRPAVLARSSGQPLGTVPASTCIARQ